MCVRADREVLSREQRESRNCKQKGKRLDPILRRHFFGSFAKTAPNSFPLSLSLVSSRSFCELRANRSPFGSFSATFQFLLPSAQCSNRHTHTHSLKPAAANQNPAGTSRAERLQWGGSGCRLVGREPLGNMQGIERERERSK